MKAGVLSTSVNCLLTVREFMGVSERPSLSFGITGALPLTCLRRCFADDILDSCLRRNDRFLDAR